MVSPVDAFSSLATAQVTPRANLQDSDSGAASAVAAAKSEPEAGQTRSPGPSDLPAVNRVNEAVEPTGEIRQRGSAADAASQVEGTEGVSEQSGPGQAPAGGEDLTGTEAAP